MKRKADPYVIELPNAERAAYLGVPEGFPLPRHPDGSFREFDFGLFDWLHSTSRAEVGVLRKLAFNMRSWTGYALHRGWDPERPSDSRLADWRRWLSEDPSGPRLDICRANSNAASVFRAFVFVHVALPEDGCGRRRSPVVVDAAAATADVLTARSGSDGLSWSLAKRGVGFRAARPIPADEEVAHIMTRLRSGRLGDGRGPYPNYLADRNWLAGRCMSGAGCRSFEVARGITLDAILEMLVKHRLPVRRHQTSDLHPLDEMAADPQDWGRLLASLDAMVVDGRQMSMSILGKGQVRRLAPVGCDLVRDLLVTGVASMRPAQVRAWRSAGWTGTVPTNLILSEKTKARCTEGSIGGVVNDAFGVEPAIPGSAQRLRAFYALKTAIRILGDHLSHHRGMLSFSGAEAVYRELAGALGHSTVSTTVVFYLDMARLYHAASALKRDTIFDVIWREVADAPENVTARKLRLMTQTIRSLLAATDESEFASLLELLPSFADLLHPMNVSGPE